MKLRHYSATKKVVECKGLDPTSWTKTPWVLPKPPAQHVMWLSVGAAWIKWVKEEMPHWMPKYKHWRNVDVDERKMIVIDTARKARAFNKKYGVVQGAWTMIDWARVASGKKCGLLLINDFLRDMPLESLHGEFHWAWSFDVSSAVVWSGRCCTTS
jgi:hypothetical protein